MFIDALSSSSEDFTLDDFVVQHLEIEESFLLLTYVDTTSQLECVMSIAYTQSNAACRVLELAQSIITTSNFMITSQY